MEFMKYAPHELGTRDYVKVHKHEFQNFEKSSEFDMTLRFNLCYFARSLSIFWCICTRWPTYLTLVFHQFGGITADQFRCYETHIILCKIKNIISSKYSRTDVNLCCINFILEAGNPDSAQMHYFDQIWIYGAIEPTRQRIRANQSTRILATA